MKNSGKRALISVYYKDGIDKIGKALHANGWEITSTGGTASFLEENSIPVTRVSDITGFPEILGGRVKTLHPKIFGPILAQKNNDHLKELEKLSLSKIDLVIVNFYPFEEFLKKNSSLETMIEKIDIGGPTMVRAAAKNYMDTIVIVKESDYNLVEDKVIPGALSSSDRKELSSKAFSYTSYYDSLVANYLNEGTGFENDFLTIAGKKFFSLRYGENPHQKGAIYITDSDSPIKNLHQLQGKQLSYNNVLDLSVVYDMINQFHEEKDHFCVVVKHQNPCGAALHAGQSEAFENALSGDPVSAFGGIIGFNHKVDKLSAEKMSKMFLEVIIAPEFSEDSINILKKKKNLRLIELKPGYLEKNHIKSIQGGFIIQEKDNLNKGRSEFDQKTAQELTESEKQDVSFGWKIIKYIKSNAILIVKDKKILGVGAGQMSRIDSVNIAINKSGSSVKGSILLSDAFFPFSDSIETASDAGISVVVEPGGSVRDDEVIKAADSFGISLLFTGVRHFLH